MTKAIDFESLDTEAASEKAQELELVHPSSKKGLGVFLSLLGPDSKAFKERLRKEVDRDRARAFKAERGGKGAEPKTLAEDEQLGIQLTADLVKGWRTVTDGKSENVIIWKGEKLEFNQDNLVRWLTAFQWAIGQINDFTKDLENYLGN